MHVREPVSGRARLKIRMAQLHCVSVQQSTHYLTAHFPHIPLSCSLSLILGKVLLCCFQGWGLWMPSNHPPQSLNDPPPPASLRTITTLQVAGEDLSRCRTESRSAETGFGIDTWRVWRAPVNTGCWGRRSGDGDQGQKAWGMNEAMVNCEFKTRGGKGREDGCYCNRKKTKNSRHLGR